MATIIDVRPTTTYAAPALPKAEPCTLVIFGATGDLTKRKLIPALYDLACVGCMSPHFDILGIGRKPLTDEQFRESLKEAASHSKDARNFSSEGWEDFAKRITYLRADTDSPAAYSEIASRLAEMQSRSVSSNLLFYLATPSSLFAEIIQGLGAAHLNRNEKGWTRIVVEKPFGSDLKSAEELNRVLTSVFDEESVYRIDHYLGKETVQNILVFRFGNLLFEPVWNRNYIDYVEITGAETLGVEQRASFYEETGALRDMVANHMLQLLSLTAMEPPLAFDAGSVRSKKVEVFNAIRPMTVSEVAERTIRGQYGSGQIDGKPVPGYRQEQGVAQTSATETYAAVQFFIDNWRWAGVPFFVRTGKRLSRNLTEIAVHFKRTPQALFAHESDQEVERNVIAFRIQPNEGITVDFAAKRPGTEMHTANVQLNFRYREAFGTKTPVAYETLLLDAMRGDATLFTRRDEVEAEWKLITPIEQAWAQLPPSKFPNYAAGSEGPDSVEMLPGQYGWHWRTLDPLA
ncbi:MAG TPA: glucose-6-phosphate dehydrogenase [Terriglobales bacterium]|nr:glucose-6-phosphate dehydrogenase [Terriglobales bacterium]